MEKIRNLVFLLLLAVTSVSSVSPVQDGYMRDCQELRERLPTLPTGVYTIYPAGKGMSVWCDMDTDGGGWTVFQRRFDGSVDFYQSWAAYVRGFGQVNRGEFWLGNDNIHVLTNTGFKDYELRIDMVAYGDKAFAAFSKFSISGATELYRLHASGYKTSSTAGDSMTYHSGQPFSTRDADYDGMPENSCALTWHGAWWYGGYLGCHESNLNGRYDYTAANQGQVGSKGASITYKDYKGYYYALKAVSMKVRRQGYRARCLETDVNPLCPRMAADGKCTQPDVQRYCRKSCLC